MSFDAMRWAAVQHPKPIAKLVLLMLANRANDAAQCWPSLPQLAKDTGLSQRAVQNAVAELVKAGLVQRVERSGKGILYTLPIGSEQGTLAADATPLAPRATPPTHDVPPTLAADATHPSTSCHQTSKEPIKEEKSRSLRSLPAREEPPPIEAGFAEFYAAYPRKKKPDDALKAWRQVVRAGATAAEIMAGLSRHQFRDEVEFIPYPASWLRAGAWKDEPDPVPSAQQQRAPPRRETPSEQRRRKLGIASILDWPNEPDPDPEPTVPRNGLLLARH